MADIVISLKIPSEKVAVAVEGFLTIYPNNETMPDPNWVDPEDGSSAPEIPKYATTKVWVTERIRRIVVRDIHRGLQMKKAAEDAVVVDDETVGVSE